MLSNTTSGELVSLIGASKTAGVDTYQNGTSIPYVINLTNSDDTPLTGLVITDDLGAVVFGDTLLQPLTFTEGSLRLFLDGVLQPTPAYTLTPALTITNVTIPAGGVTTILYSAAANEFAPPGATGSVTNTVSINGTTLSEITASATVTADPGAILTMQKAVSPAVVSQNDTLTYTFLIENFGAGAAGAEENAVVTDLFQPALQNLTVTLDGTPWTDGDQYTYDPQTGLFESAAGAITVPAAAYTQDPETGAWTTTPGSVTLTVSGTV